MEDVIGQIVDATGQQVNVTGQKVAVIGQNIYFDMESTITWVREI